MLSERQMASETVSLPLPLRQWPNQCENEPALEGHRQWHCSEHQCVGMCALVVLLG